MKTPQRLRMAFLSLLMPLLVFVGLTGEAAIARPEADIPGPRAFFSDPMDQPDSMHVVWQFSLRLNVVETPTGARHTPRFKLLETDGSAVFAVYDQTIYAIDLLTGRTSWERTLGVGIEDLALRPDTLVVAAGKNVYALNPESGHDRWAVTHGSETQHYLTNDDRTIYSTTFEGGAVALEPATGAVRWRHHASHDAGDYRFYHRPTAGGGMVILAGSSTPLSIPGSVVALDAVTGEAIWSKDLARGSIGNPAVAEGVVYIGVDARIGAAGMTDSPPLRQQHLYAIDARTGETRWAAPTNGFVSEAPLAENGVVFAAVERMPLAPAEPYAISLIALDAFSGELSWTFEPTGTSVSGVIRSENGALYVSVFDGDRGVGDVYALDPVTGQPFWSYLAGNGLTAAPAVAGDYVLVAGEISDDTVVTALGPGAVAPSFGWQLLTGFSAVTIAVAIFDFLLRRAGGSKIARLSGALTSRPVRLAVAVIIAGGIGLAFGGSAGYLATWLALMILALVETIVRAEVTTRRRMLGAAAFWMLLTLALSLDATNQQYGTLRLLDEPSRFAALCLVGALGSILFTGWGWPALLGLAWTGGVAGSLLLLTIHNGTDRYLDAWRTSLSTKVQPPFLGGLPAQFVVSATDLMVLAVVGGSVVFASAALCWVIGRSPSGRRMEVFPAILLGLFIAAATLGAIEPTAFSTVLLLIPVAGLIVGLIVRTRRAFPVTLAVDAAMALGAAGGIVVTHGLVYTWQTPTCDALFAFCTPSQLTVVVVLMMGLSLLGAGLGVGGGRLIIHPPVGPRDHPVAHHPA